MTLDSIRGRFAPSPTGEMHLGNAWTALLAWLHTRSQQGRMVLRIEDLDPDRSRKEFVKQLLEDMAWLGLDWDEGPDIGGDYGPYCQSERRDLYEAALKRLEAAKLIYPCYCTRAELHAVASAPHLGEQEFVYPGTCRLMSSQEQAEREKQPRRSSLRLTVPDEAVSFRDGLQGEYTQNVRPSCGDFVVRRSDGVFAYQLAVVVDDGLMAINQVLRGADLLASTPRQLLLYQLLGLKAPAFIHVPLLLGKDGSRLSKRHGSLSLASMRSRGVKADTIIGYLAWKAGQIDTWEQLSAREAVSLFSLQSIPAMPVVVDDAP